MGLSNKADMGIPFSSAHFVTSFLSLVNLSWPRWVVRKSIFSTLGESSFTEHRRRNGKCSSWNARGRCKVSWQNAIALSSSCWPMQQFAHTFELSENASASGEQTYKIGYYGYFNDTSGHDDDRVAR